ncbi:DUF4252 domain-containing protein [Pseudotenacibaculum haliotis]|uniref:DUF4252 domain-containing protein n=1 Tax=Pseudotenacibaculum haliotis TaxID=1862138 RepID=A0ABW5LUQ2_9FLAO
MKKITTVLALFVLTLFASCNSEESLQQYMVASQEKDGFMTIDIPINFIKPKSLDVPADVQETIKSIKKVNLVALPYQGNEEAYTVEKDKLNKILKTDKYKSLMRMNAQGIKMNIYYTGSADAIDEVIAFGYAKDKGVGVARILGENMDPSKIITMMNNITLDGDQLNLRKFNLAF